MCLLPSEVISELKSERSLLLGTPEDVARMIGVLLNDELTGYVTGATIPVDGGMALHNWITPTNLE